MIVDYSFLLCFFAANFHWKKQLLSLVAFFVISKIKMLFVFYLLFYSLEN